MPKKPTIPTSIRFDVEMHTKLESLAEKEHRTLSHQVQHLVAQALAAQQPAAAA